MTTYRLTIGAPIALLALVATLLIAATPAQAQPQQEEQLSPEQFMQLMEEVNARMRDIERMLAKASLAPEDLSTIMSQLREAARASDLTRLPGSLREFLYNNPDLLARLQAPDAEGDELLQVEDDIRRLLATEQQGLEILLQQNPDMLERLLEQQEEIQGALRQHADVENDLQRLFTQTEDQLGTTESDIERLIQAAHQMQQQMNQGQGQPQDNQLDQPQDGQQQDQQQRPDQQNQESQQDGGAQNAQNNYNASQSENPTGSGGNDDDGAWATGLPARDLEAARSARDAGVLPGWEAENSEYFRLLSLLQSGRTPPGEDAGSDDNSGSDSDD